MNNGSFFRLDLERSKVVDGVTFYDYIDLPDYSSGREGLSYPVRLSISNDRVIFFVHYYDRIEEKDRENKPWPEHLEEVILDLPFTTGEQDALSSKIKHIYNTPFPINGYLCDLVIRRYTNKTDSLKQNTENSEKEKFNNLYQALRDSKVNEDSYSSLSIWGLLDKNKKYDLITITEKNEEKVTKFLRKLLLDFMFDLMHTDVFQASKYYQQMKEGLMADFFFSSIIKKSEYYYYRRLIRKRYDISNNEEDFSETIKKLYAKQFDGAESEWTEIIMTPEADQHFTFYPDWFEDQPQSRKRKENEYHISENSWFVNPEEEMSRIVFPLEEEKGKNQYKEVHYLNSLELSNYIKATDNTAIEKRKTKISQWFYQRYDFADTIRMHIFRKTNNIILGLLGLFVLCSLCPYFWETPRWIALFFAAASLAFVTAAIYLKFYIKTPTTKRIDDILAEKRRTRECSLSARLGIIFAFIGCFLFFYNVLDSLFGLAMKLVVLLSLLLFSIRSKTNIIKNIHLFFPRLVASITAAWIMLVIGNDLIKEHLSMLIAIILVIVVFTFLLYESNKALPDIDITAQIGRALELMLISFSMALIIGIFAIDIVSLDMLSPHCPDEPAVEIINYPWRFLSGSEACTITVIPEYLIQFSFLAMFIGVFIQMIFEEKSITDM